MNGIEALAQFYVDMAPRVFTKEYCEAHGLPYEPVREPEQPEQQEERKEVEA
jgi:hypothetical protein